jgi:hypothetical protein
LKLGFVDGVISESTLWVTNIILSQFVGVSIIGHGTKKKRYEKCSFVILKTTFKMDIFKIWNFLYLKNHKGNMIIWSINFFKIGSITFEDLKNHDF